MYTDEFKERVRENYSRLAISELDDVLEGRPPSKEWDLGRILRIGSTEYKITATQVVEAVTADDVLMLKAKAAMIVTRERLYQDWLDSVPGVNVDCQTVARAILREAAN